MTGERMHGEPNHPRPVNEVIDQIIGGTACGVLCYGLIVVFVGRRCCHLLGWCQESQLWPQ